MEVFSKGVVETVTLFPLCRRTIVSVTLFGFRAESV